MFPVYVALAVAGLVLLAGARIVRPTGRGLVERFGKYRRLALPGFNWIIPLIDRMFLVNITEVMVNAERQEIITSDKLNARVDAQVYFKVKSDEESVKSFLNTTSSTTNIRSSIWPGRPSATSSAR